MQTLKTIRSIPKQWEKSTFGIEFECRHPFASSLWNTHRGFFFFSADGSLSWTEGLEIISQPLPKELLIKKLQKLQTQLGNSLYSDPNGAIHIHIPQKRISKEQAINLRHSICFYPVQLLVDFAGRYPNGYCKLTSLHPSDRQVWINPLNKNTIEFRGFTNYTRFGIDWAICCLNRLDYWLDHPTIEGMKEAINKYPYQTIPNTPTATLGQIAALGQILRERIR